MSPNAYYNYKKSNKALYYSKKEFVKETITDIYHEYSGRPGYRMMTIFLKRRGIFLSSQTVRKYMKELRIRSIRAPRKPRYHKGECYKKFDNLLNQDFTVDSPNKKWCTDFTHLFLKDGAKRYNCSIIDLYDRSPVATLNGKRITAQLATETLKLALVNNNIGSGLIIHSDQGSQFTSMEFTEFCSNMGIRQSMSRAGCPYDNSPMESFYGTFKSEYINEHSFETDEDLNNGTLDYVYCYYNHIRPHSYNGYLTPFEKRNSCR